MSRLWTSLELVRAATDYFAERQLATPRLDAEVLLAHALGVRRLDLYLGFDRPAESDERSHYRELVRRRAADRVPVAYLTGTREFWSRPFRVSPAVLIPRPETETLIQAALECPAERVLELGVGSGAIAGTLALERPDWRIVATDVSAQALRVARENLAALGVPDRVALVQADALQALRGDFDLIVSNPPYVPSPELAELAPELHHEPRRALDGGGDGLDVIRRILQDAGAALHPAGGRLLLEIGAGQAPAVAELLREQGATRVECRRDLAGVERVLCAEYGPGARTAPQSIAPSDAPCEGGSGADRTRAVERSDAIGQS